MALRRQEQRRDQIAGRSFWGEFAKVAQSSVPAHIQSPLKHLLLSVGPRAAMNQQGLVITLRADGFLGGDKIVAALGKTPDLEKYIFFKDVNVVRPCREVVFDLETRALELARVLYKEAAPYKRIIITPATRGFCANTPSIVECMPQTVTNRYGHTVTVHTDIAVDGDFWSAEKKKAGQRHAIQTNSISLKIIEDDMSVMRLQVKASAAMSHGYHVQKETDQHVFTFN